MATRVGVRIPVRKKQRAGAEVPAPAELPELVKVSKPETAEDPAPEEEDVKAVTKKSTKKTTK